MFTIAYSALTTGLTSVFVIKMSAVFALRRYAPWQKLGLAGVVDVFGFEAEALAVVMNTDGVT